MKTLKRKLEKMESQLLESEKYTGCELEMIVGVNDNMETEATYFKICPEGRKEIDYPEAMRLMEHSTECDVSIID